MCVVFSCFFLLWWGGEVRVLDFSVGDCNLGERWGFCMFFFIFCVVVVWVEV